MNTADDRIRIKTAGRIVVKIGSALLVDSETGLLHSKWLESLAQDIAACRARGQEIIIVSERAQVTRTSLTELREVSRRTQGVWIVRQLMEDDEIVSIASMESRVRTERDTKPRPVADRSLPALIDGLSEEPSSNGHQKDDGDEEGEGGQFAFKW